MYFQILYDLQFNLCIWRIWQTKKFRNWTDVALSNALFKQDRICLQAFNSVESVKCTNGPREAELSHYQEQIQALIWYNIIYPVSELFQFWF